MTTYDTFPYLHGAVPHSHPPQAVKRVLEIGCGVGENAAAIAAKYPETEVIGFDLNAKHIEIGRKNHDLPNLTLLQHDLAQPFDHGEFEWVIAHGVLSWISPDLWEMFFSHFRWCLSRTGTGYVSYNTNPGCSVKMALRSVLLRHWMMFSNQRLALEQVKLLLLMLSETDTTLGKEAKSLLKAPDWFIVHDHLEEYNTPLWFEDFCAMLSKSKLEYVGDVQPHADRPDDPELIRTLEEAYEGDNIKVCAVTDWFRDRQFRQSLIRKVR